MAARFPTPQAESCVDGGSEDPLTCLICTEPFDDPKVLPCHHTFCAQCLEKYFRTFHRDGDQPPGTFPCPVCRQAVQVPEGGLRGLSAEAKTEHIQELVAKISTHKKVHCDVCKYKKQDVGAIDHCTSCAINYCEHCAKDHNKHWLFTNHATVPVTQMDKSALKCEIHEAEHLRYYCATCTTPLCTVCAVSDHRNHRTMELSDALGNKKEAIQDKFRLMSERVMHAEERLAQLEDIQNIREAAAKKTRLEIERHVAALVGQLHQRKQQLIAELDRSHEAGTKSLLLEKENCSFTLANMKSLWKFAAKLTEPSQTLQLLAMYGDLNKMVEGVVSAPEPKLPKECSTMHMFMPKEHMSVGELQTCALSEDLVRRITSAGDLSNGSERAPSPTPSPTPFQYYEPMNLKWQAPRLVWKADKIGQKTGDVNEAYDVAITPNGTVVAAEWLNQRLQVFDSTGFSKEIIGSGLVQPWGVTLTREGNYAITDEKDRTVKLFTPQGSSLVTWKKQMFGWPRGIAVTSSGQFVVSDTQHGKHTVSLHLPDGACIRQVGSQGSGNDQFHWPRYVAVDHHDRILVSDSSNHCIKVLDSTGHFLFKFGSIGNGDGHMKHPRGLCVCPNDNVVVADQDNHRVTLYSPDGKFIRHLLAVQKPWGVALSEGGLLAVTQKPAVSLYKVFDPMP